MQILIILGVVSVIIFIYIGTMYLNEKVAIPESCKEAYAEAQTCESCSRNGTSCNLKETMEFLKEVKL